MMVGSQTHSAPIWRSLFWFSIAWAVAAAQIRYSIHEEMKEGSFVGNIVKDLGLTVEEISVRRVRLVSTGKSQHFAFSSRNGFVYINDQIDRERICAHASPCLLHFELIAESPMALYRAEVEVRDINDNDPRFLNDEMELEISEIAAVGTALSLPRASDPDEGWFSVSTYSLGENEYFELEEKGVTDEKKQAQLVLQKPLDREDVAVHRLILTATDGGDPARSGTLQIRVVVLDINDNPPVFTQSLYKVSVREDEAQGTLLTTVRATDADEGSNAEVNYHLLGSHPETSIPIFKLNSQTGNIFLDGKLDFEDTKFYEIEIEAKGNGGLVGQSKMLVEVVDINDNPPQITITSFSNSVSEDCTPGTVIAIFNVYDADSRENGQITCSISENLPFQLKTSFDHYYTLVTGHSLDREEASEYQILITAEDCGEPVLSATHVLTLEISDINDNPPVFENPSYTIFVKENNPTATSIFSVKAIDLDWDHNSQISYSLIHDFKDNPSSYVSVNADTGIIYALRSFDYEQCSEFTLHVKAQDRGSPPLSANTTVILYIVDQNDNSPQILYPSLPTDGSTGVELAPPSSVPGQLVSKVVAVDADSGQNAWLSYQIQKASENGLFTVNLYNGEIRTARAFQEKDALRQNVVVLVKDHGRPSLSTSVTVSVLLSDSIPEILSDENNTKSAKEEINTNLTLFLVISIVFISCLFLLLLIVLLAKRLMKLKESKHFKSTSLKRADRPSS
ncbi:hypothetical protein NDU88_006452 [Pleurodeles waltl]|uniref:Cadherin domain-containing protein n=1 Tax=Pleurodeles waltl TaxID=8319 RepID=A0AAV7PLU4_PLEWA|nr:hypothetical protein NDU88_006452 [Pleurodeles waltl]